MAASRPIHREIISVLRWIVFIFLLALILSCRLASAPDQAEVQPTSTRIVINSSSPTQTTALVPGSTPEKSLPTIRSSSLIQPSDLVYLGAFRLPDAGERPKTFEYGGNAMTFYPGGDAQGPGDGFPGSLFVTGHDRLPYGEMPDGDQLAEISIPQPVISKAPAKLNTAGFLQDFHDVAAGYFKGLDEIPRLGLAFLDTPATGPKLHLAWGQHIQPDEVVASHAWLSLDLAHSDLQGTWFIGSQSLDSVNGYNFTIPTGWADQNASGRYLATGRFRDGGWSGMGPALFAYQPWVDEKGTPAAPGTHLEETVLLLYQKSTESETFERALTGYQHPDEWEGGAWLTTSAGKSGVLFAGTKSNGDKYWYGFVNPSGPQAPCVEGEMVGQFPICRLANGELCPQEDLIECPNHSDYRGWWSTHFDAEFILYNPDDLARVARGEMDLWAPQPYVSMDIDPYLLNNPAGVEPDMIGSGDQRRFRIGDVAYDREHNLVYVLELFADGAKPVVHAWQLK